MEDFDRIYAEYFSHVYRFALSLARDAALAEEITQETFFKALKGIDGFKGECRIGTWLFRIAKNTFYSHVRKRKRLSDSPVEALVSDEDIEERFADREAARAIHRALHRLDEPYKEVFWLRTFAELPYQEIAELFGKTESWARVTYYRARMMIKEGLQ